MTSTFPPNAIPERIRLSRARGWRMPENTVKVDRSTPWGNPFIVGEHGTRAECVTWFRYILAGYYQMACGPELADMQRYFRFAHDHIGELRGRNLACWCPIGAPCHEIGRASCRERV